MISVDPCQSEFLKEEVRQPFMPQAKKLFEAVEGLEQFADHTSICFCLRAFWDVYVHELVDEPVQEGCFYIHLVDVKVKKGCNSEQYSESYWFYNSSEGLVKVNSKLLQVALDYSSGLETSNIAIDVSLYLVDLLST